MISIASYASDPEARLGAWGYLNAINEFEEDSEIAGIFFGALQVRDPEVRKAALNGLLNRSLEIEIPFDALADVALKDTIPLNRGQALELLVDKHGKAASKILNQGMMDSASLVRAYATGLKSELKLTTN